MEGLLTGTFLISNPEVFRLFQVIASNRPIPLYSRVKSFVTTTTHFICRVEVWDASQPSRPLELCASFAFLLFITWVSLSSRWNQLILFHTLRVEGVNLPLPLTLPWYMTENRMWFQKGCLLTLMKESCTHSILHIGSRTVQTMGNKMANCNPSHPV